MTTGKTIVCPCEDVTARELEDAVEKGYEDVESIKRYTGLATGPCQGKSCVVLCRRLLADILAVEPGELGGITYRPPVRPLRLGELAGEEVPEDG